MSNSTLCFCFCLLFSSSSLFAQLSPAGAVNTSGKQRYLSQRMGKDFVFMAADLNKEAALKELNSSKIIFEENLKALIAFAPNEAIKTKLAKEDALWREYKVLLEKEANKPNALAVLNFNTQLLTAANDVVEEIVKFTSSLANKNETITSAAVANNTNTSGRMRMLSQRLTMYYAAYYNDMGEGPTSLKLLKTAAENIQAGLSGLITSEINSAEIDDAMSEAIADWHEIEEKCTKDNCFSFENKGMDPKVMFTTTNKILAKMDKITGMYARLLD